MKFMGIADVNVALEAVNRNGDALQYVLSFDLFVSIASKLYINVD